VASATHRSRTASRKRIINSRRSLASRKLLDEDGIQFNHTLEGRGRFEGIKHPIPFK
jgi:hypothetical protein